ncbi:hypothetical protein ACWDYH_00680 [Nocardia goodfellowii]|uniref:PE domain-containing protein n=1 Tax=Nocardia goodfellowii TaxID=882446 RepID=A0ABS4QCS3_9NOCA|nr:hypothetical protein [Nocardia goodfellowii]MBP2189358.1 hypothetical protein [Nocardia goodfellowii]
MQPNTTTLNQAVQDGQLWIDGVLVADGAHEKCARRYELLAEQVEAQIEVLRAATTLPGFGGFDSGAALRGGFENKAAVALTELRDYAAAARELAQTLRAAAAAYQRGDEELAVAVGRMDLGVPNA